MEFLEAIRRSETMNTMLKDAQFGTDCYNISGKLVMHKQPAASIMNFISSSIFIGVLLLLWL